jgi:hypothetical protein
MRLCRARLPVKRILKIILLEDTVFGCTLLALGMVLSTGGRLRLPTKSDIQVASIVILMGTVSFAVGKFRQKKRLLIYEHGIAQTKWGKADAILWRDIRQVRLERETHYGSGLAYKVRYHYSLQRGDGTWLAFLPA